MATYQVTVSEKKKDVNGGATVQSLTLKNDAGAEKAGVEMFLPAGQPAPVVGKPLEGAVEWDDKFKVFKFKPASRRGPYNGRSREFKADPQKNAAVATEASQKVAVDIIRLALETKQDPAELARMTVDTARVLLEQIRQEMEAAK